MKKVIFLLIIVSMFWIGATDVYAMSGKNYYVSEQGKDSNSGSKNHPFATINRALEILKPSDTLIIRQGTYNEQIYISSRLKGTKKAPITIRSAAGEKVVISGKNMKSPTLLTLDGSSHIRIHGLEFADAKGQNACAILVKPGTNYFNISNNKIYNIKVSNPTEDDRCANCILLFGESKKNTINNGVINGNKIYNCQTGWAECISVTANVSNILINNNQITNTGNIGIDISGNYGYCKSPAYDFPRNIKVIGNTVTKCRSVNATSYGIYVDGGQNVSISNNTITKCSGGIEVGAEQKPRSVKYATKNISVKDNIVKNNLENGITVGGYKKELGWVHNVLISNNACINNGLNNAILTLAKCNNVKVRYNTFVNTSKSATIVYSEFDSNYTKNISFYGNRYANGNSKNNTSIVYLGREYTSFDAWVRQTHERSCVYSYGKMRV